MNKFEEIKKVMQEAEADAAKFYGGKSKAAGARVRAALLKVKELAHEGRKEISEMKA
jgi:nanoRNase/pAp phosphatase (c-di-AMP/oligoRNAs hydrolase)